MLCLQLDSAQTDGDLVCGLAEANAKALEHKLLLSLLLPAPPTAEGAAEGEEPPARMFRWAGRGPATWGRKERDGKL